MIPLSDERTYGPAPGPAPATGARTRRRLPIVTLLVMAACVVVFFAVQPTRITTRHLVTPGLELVDRDDLEFLTRNAAIPCELVRGRPLTRAEFRDTFFGNDPSACADAGGRPHSPGKVVYLALLTSMFLHGSPEHLFGNLLFLWVFGNDIEERWGRLRYLLLYLVGGVVATAAHVVTDVHSTVPLLGASGAIAAVMGAYLVCFPANRVKTIIFWGPLQLRKVKAAWLLGIWLALQLLLIPGDSGIAWAAHVGGFVFGAACGLVWRLRHHPRPQHAPCRAPGPVTA